MRIESISLLNYRNLREVNVSFSPKVNCLIGSNGMGKTNLLDAVYYLSFCKSSVTVNDSQNIFHEEPFFMIQGNYITDSGISEEISCGLKRGEKKQFKRNKKSYDRLSDHIGSVPLVMVSPADNVLIAGGSEERRRFVDMVISQYDSEYLNALTPSTTYTASPQLRAQKQTVRSTRATDAPSSASIKSALDSAMSHYTRYLLRR